ncbi:MAG: cytochrome c3 family protein [Myxococcales bacterium]|nr:cytochrome c3 family protein [Myxococcales bacterium]
MPLWLLLLLGLLLPLGAAAEGGPGPLPADAKYQGSEEIAAPADPDSLKDPRWCRVCHPAERFTATVWKATAHHEQRCTDCHSGYHFNPHQPVELGPHAGQDEAGASPERRKEAAKARCTTCHSENKPIIEKVVHGEGREGSPTCADCHGEAHSVVTVASQDKLAYRRAMNARCEHCHADEAKMAKVELTTRSVDNYHHSVHGRQLGLGGEESPGCVDCHGGHQLTDFEKDGPKTCGECHTSANAEFVTLGDHRRYTRDERPVSFFTLKFFAWLTFLSIMALCVHVLLDVLATARVTWARRRRGDDA